MNVINGINLHGYQQVLLNAGVVWGFFVMQGHCVFSVLLTVFSLLFHTFCCCSCCCCAKFEELLEYFFVLSLFFFFLKSFLTYTSFELNQHSQLICNLVDHAIN